MCVRKPRSQSGMSCRPCSKASAKGAVQRNDPGSAEEPELPGAKPQGDVLEKNPVSTARGRAVKKRPAAAKHEQRVDGNATAGCTGSVQPKKPAASVRATASGSSEVQGARRLSGQCASVPGLTPAIIQAIDDNLAIHFPHLPRPPSEEFYRLLHHILGCGDLPLADGFRLAEEHRREGRVWP